jgi:hypothetical protein
MKCFVVIQPGMDVYAQDVATFTSNEEEWIKYIVARGGDPLFFEGAAIGDAMPFDRERVVLCVGKLW